MVVATLSALVLSGCAQLGFQRPNAPPAQASRLPRSKTETAYPEVKSPTDAKKVALPKQQQPATPPFLPDAPLPVPTVPIPKVAEVPSPAPEVKGPAEEPSPTLSTPPGTPTAQLTETPTLQREPAVEAFHSILEGRNDEALNHLKKYDEATQELFLRLLPPLALLTRKSIGEFNTSEVAALHDGMARIVDIIRPRTELVIARACFCERVNSFGNYRALPDGHQFLPSAPNRPGERAQLYVAVKNFNNELRKDFYETRLSSAVEIHDSKGEKIWYYRFEDRDKPIRTTEPLHDCFNNYSFFVPNLPAGNYTLTICIADETLPDRRRETRKALDFRVGASTR